VEDNRESHLAQSGRLRAAIAGTLRDVRSGEHRGV
jgi:hypothetical protein